MRLTASLISALALTTALAACAPQSDVKAPVQMPAKMKDTQKSQSGFDKTLANAQAKVEARLDGALDIPTPKNPGGGYTHETHKANGFLLYDVGQLYKLTGDKKYAEFAGQAMMDYADVYPSWGLHPAK